jgi:hypothetical protein
MASVSPGLLQRLQQAQQGGKLGDIVGHEEAAAWGGRDLSSASYDELVSAFGASDLQDPAMTAPGGSPSPVSTAPSTTPTAPGAPGSPPPPTGTASPIGTLGMGSPGGESGPAMQRLMAEAPTVAGWSDPSLMGGGPSMPGARQYPRQGTALSQMMRQGRGRIY